MWGRSEREGQRSEEGTRHPKTQCTLKATKYCHRQCEWLAPHILILYYLWTKIKKHIKAGDCSIIAPTSVFFSVWKPTGFANISNTKAAKIHLSSGSPVPLHPTTQSLSPVSQSGWADALVHGLWSQDPTIPTARMMFCHPGWIPPENTELALPRLIC